MVGTQAVEFCASRTVEDWRRYQRKQNSKYFPRKDGNEASSSRAERGWELSVASISGIPVAVEGKGLKLYFTPFDLESKSFFGNTLESESFQPLHEQGSWKCNANKLVHFWSGRDQSKTVIVMELVKVHVSGKDGVETLQESIGWVPIPLNVLDGAAAEENQGKLFEIPLLEGTPRVLLFSGASKGKPLGECKTIFSVRHSEGFLGACGRLVLDSCLVDEREVIPGCTRFDARGLETFKVFAATTPLDAPQATPTVDVTIRNVHFSLPPNYVESVLGELLKEAEGWSEWVKERFYANIFAHNGRREVGGTARRERLKFMKLSQDTHLQLDAEVLVRDVPEDEFVVLIVELYLDLSQEKLHLGWLPISVFSDATGSKGKQINHPLECGPGRFVDNSPLLNWEAMIAEDPRQPAFSPTVYCQVLTGSREPRVLKRLAPPMPAASLDQSIGSSAAAKMEAKDETEANREPEETVVREREEDRGPPEVAAANEKKAAREEKIVPDPPQEAPAPPPPAPEAAAQSHRPEPAKPILAPIRNSDKEALQKEGRPRPRPTRAPLAAAAPAAAPAQVKESNKRVLAAVKKTSSGRPATAKAVKKDLGVSRATMAKLKLQDVDLPQDSRGPQARTFTAEPKAREDLPDMEKEMSDTKTVNEIVVQLLAYKSSTTSSVESLYFTLSFFDFQESTTCKVALERSGESDVYMFKNAVRGSVMSPEGLTLKFKVDREDAIGLEERRERLCEYLLTKKLQLNVWDGKSMFQHGFATVDLRSLLRQGKDVVEQLQEVEIRRLSDLDPEESRRDQSRRESLKLSGLVEEAAGGQERASLILRLINVGSEKDVQGSARDSVNLDDTKRSLLKRPEVVMQELNINPSETGSLIHQLIEVEKRRYKRKERYAGHEVSDNYELGYKIRQKLHEDVCHVKLMNRENIIKSKLRQKLVGKKMLKARVGEVLFFEEKFTNPRGSTRTFRIEVSDPELSLVLRTEEWSHLRATKKTESIASAPESDILDGNRLFLGSFDECHVPFKYCPMDSAGSVRSATEKVVHVSLVCEATGVVESQIEILIEVHPCVVDQTFNLHTPEYSIFKHRFAIAEGFGRALNGRTPSEVKSIRTNDQNTIVKLEGSEVVVKCTKSGAAPESRNFLTFFYGDRFQSELLQVWRFTVATARKLDISGLTGQTTISNLVVRGSAMSRKVRCFTSHPDEIRVVPEEFTLISDSLSELQVSFCPLTAGGLDARLNIVDAEGGGLVQQILLSARAEDPPVSKTYELAAASGSVHESKISYENPWPARRTFCFKPAHPWLVRVQPGLLDLEPGAPGVVGISFRAEGLDPGMYETLVFVNDVDGNNEDCVRLQIRVLPR